ncbi:MAG: hypothetical protein ACUVQF_05970 [Fervidobacterium sp.]|uniref:hypothetical protein n=1 Tax=Fervidobacterium sp. TaxID=1871331 RepID=UPI004048EF41
MILALSKFLIMFFSFASIEKSLILNIHFWIYLVVATISITFMHNKKKLLTSIFSIVTILFSISFLKPYMLACISALLITLALLSKKYSNKWIVTFVYIFLLSLMHHSLSPILALLYILLTFPELMQPKRIGENKIWISVLLIALIFIAPLPDLRFNMDAFKEDNGVVYTPKDLNVTYERSGNTQTAQTNKKNTAENLNKSESLTADAYAERISLIRKIDYFINIDFIVGLVIGLIFIAYIFTSVLRTSDSKQKKKLVKSLILSLAILITFFAIFPIVLNIAGNRTVENINQMRATTNSTSSGTSGLNSVAQIPKNLQNSTQDSVKDSINDELNKLRLILIFKFITAVIGVVSLIWTGKSFVEMLMTKETVEEQTESGKAQSEDAGYRTPHSYDEILKMNGAQFVHHAYHYIRQMFYPTFNHLTPYELVEKSYSKELKNLTDTYVLVKYAFVNDIQDEKIQALRDDFIRLIESLKTMSFPSDKIGEQLI